MHKARKLAANDSDQRDDLFSEVSSLLSINNTNESLLSLPILLFFPPLYSSFLLVILHKLFPCHDCFIVAPVGISLLFTKNVIQPLVCVPEKGFCFFFVVRGSVKIVETRQICHEKEYGINDWKIIIIQIGLNVRNECPWKT